MDVGEAEFPVFVGRVDARTEPLRLFISRQVQKDFDDLGAVAVQVVLEVADRPVALLPEGLVVDQLIGQAVSVQHRGVDPGDEDVLVVGAVEDTDPAAFGQAAGGAPEEVVLEIVIGGLFEAEDLAALRVHAGHHMADRAVFAGDVHALKDQQQRPMVGGVVQLLQ